MEERTMNKPVLTFAALLLACSLQAQESFFLKNDRLSFRYNPALAAGQPDFLSLGEIHGEVRNNVGVSAFLYPMNGEVVTGLHSGVPADTFLGNLRDLNRLQGSLDYNLAGYGFARGGAFHTIDLSLKALGGLTVPKEMFRILKLGTGGERYDLGNVQGFYNGCLELAYGYSRKVTERLSLGVRAKLLVGVDAADYSVTRMDLVWSGQEVTTTVESRLNQPGITHEGRADEDGYYGPAGAGLALDLGLAYEPADGLTLSASVTDLGGMFWFYGKCTESRGTASFTGLQEVNLTDIDVMDLLGQLGAVGSEYLGTVSLQECPKHIDFFAVPFKAHAGIKYELPFWRALTVGVTGRYAHWPGMSCWEARFGAGVAPLKWLDVTGSFGKGTYGLTYGVSAQVKVYKFRIHAGLENGIGGTVPHKSWPLQPNGKTLVVGLGYDI